jgi:hypothetical protein
MSRILQNIDGNIENTTRHSWSFEKTPKLNQNTSKLYETSHKRIGQGIIRLQQKVIVTQTLHIHWLKWKLFLHENRAHKVDHNKVWY